MRPVQKVLTTMLWACAVLALVGVIGANLWRDRARGGRAERHGEMYLAPAGTLEADGQEADAGPLRLTRDAPAFSLIDQNERPVTLQTLRGKPFIANFIFTNCAGPCPLMTQKMSKLQEHVPADVKLVSFSVDPKQDRPAVLKKYADNFRADHSRWHLLTVAKPEDADAVYTLARGMLVAAQPADENSPIIHSEKFVLVDATGVIRAYYTSGDAKQMEQLKRDAADLLAAGETQKKQH